MKYLLNLQLAVCLLLPVTASAIVQSSPNYAINGGTIVSGGSSATDVSGMNKSGIAIGQGVFIPPGGLESPTYKAEVIVVASPQVGGIHTGDINGDGKVDIVDALLALRAGVGLVQLSSQEKWRGDVGPLVNGVAVGNGRIDIEDTILILRKSVGLSW